MQYNKAAMELKDGLQKHAVITNDMGEKRILHGWGDKKSYLVGSFNDPDGQSRYGLTSNAFWVLSKLYDADTSIRETILNAFDKLDSKYGLKTFEPYFLPNTPGVGRIQKLPSGTAENGAAYIHASVFGVAALFRMGCPRKAWEQLYKSLPFTHDRVSCSPYVMPNSYGYNIDKMIDGESMQDWQTGSSNVVLKTLIRFVFGIEPHFDGIWIQPARWLPFESFRFKINIQKCEIDITYICNERGERTFQVNGVEMQGTYDDVMLLEKLWISNKQLECSSIRIIITD